MNCRNCKREQSLTDHDWEAVCGSCGHLNWIAVGDIVDVTISRTTDFGVFVDLAPNVEGIIHITELAQHELTHPNQVVSDGERVRAKILRIDLAERKIGLSIRRVAWST